MMALHSLDALFRRAVARRPDAIALADAPNRETFTDGRPRRLTYAQADRAVSAIAGRLKIMGLPGDAVIGIQMPNIVENILIVLGVLRAGLIAAPLPLLWRRADASTALARAGAKVFVTCGRVGAFDHCQLAMRVAAEVFSIRYVCGFGQNLRDGVVGFDDLLDAAAPPADAPSGGADDVAARLAVVTFDVGPDGPIPVARRHVELLAGGLGIFLESGLAPDSVILSTIAPASFAGAALGLVPWLLTGGTLVLHHPFDAEILARQCRDEACAGVILPGAVASGLAATGLFAPRARTVLAAWRAPERLAASAVWQDPNAAFVDVSIFGETGLVAARRGADGKPVPLPCGPVMAARDSAAAVKVAEISLRQGNKVALRGAMVPRQTWPPTSAESTGEDWRDTGYSGRIDAAGKTIVLAGPPSGIASVGGYRLPLDALSRSIGGIDRDGGLAVGSDPLLGQRLAGTATDAAAMQQALAAAGVNPLVVAAFATEG